MAVKANAQTAAQNWAQRFAASGAKYTAGIEAVTTAPGQLAANAAPLWAQNVAAAQSTFARNVGKVTLQAWQQAATTTGAQRLASGATKGTPKMESFMAAFIPVLTQAVAQAGPRGSFDQNIARFTKYATALHARKGTLKQ